MSYIYDFFNYGQAFWVGNALLILGLVGTIHEEKTKLKNFTRVIFLIASSLIAFSYVPISNVLFRFEIVMLLFLMAALHFGSSSLTPARIFIRFFIITACYMSINDHLKATKTPTLTTNQFDSTYILGSKLSSNENSWASILKNKLKSKVIDLTSSSTNLYSSVEEAELIPDGNSLVILLLGVEDLKKNSDPKLFEEDIHQLLWSLSKSNNTIIMFELPTSVFQKHYLKIQREYATRYGIKLIPRYALYSAIDKYSEKVSPIELTKVGHEKLAAAVLSILEQPIKVQRRVRR